jgi:hypothetical protein
MELYKKIWIQFAPETGAHLNPGERGGVPTPRAATAKLTHSLFEAFFKKHGETAAQGFRPRATWFIL